MKLLAPYTNSYFYIKTSIIGNWVDTEALVATRLALAAAVVY